MTGGDRFAVGGIENGILRNGAIGNRLAGKLDAAFGFETGRFKLISFETFGFVHENTSRE